MSDINSTPEATPAPAQSEAATKRTLISPKAKALIGSWLRVFVGALIAAVLGSQQAPWEWTADASMNFVWSGVSATLLVIYNYLNPADVRYGVGSEPTAGE